MRIPDEGRVHQRPDHGAVLAYIAFLGEIIGVQSQRRAPETPPVVPAVLRMGEILERHPEQLPGLVAEDAAQTLVDPQHAAGARVDDRHADRRQIEHEPELGLALAQCLLDAQRLGEIECTDEDAGRLARCAEHGSQDQVEPVCASGLIQGKGLANRPAAGQHLTRQRHELGAGRQVRQRCLRISRGLEPIQTECRIQHAQGDRNLDGTLGWGWRGLSKRIGEQDGPEQ